MSVFDPYELRARIIPALLLSLPLAASFIGQLDGLSESWTKAVVGIGIWFAIAYAVSFAVRTLGRRIEVRLWQRWDGPPSTRFMRWRDDHFGDQHKERVRAALQALCSLQLPTRQQEAADPSGADQTIAQAFTTVRPLIRQADPEGLWQSHNAEYGFARNMVGARWAWLIVSTLGLAVAAAPVWMRSTPTALDWLGMAVTGLCAVMAVILGWLVLPGQVRQTADRYAESAWGALVALYLAKQAENQGRQGQ